MSDALAAMRAAGFVVTEMLGAGMEGAVAALDASLVVKRWDRRSRADVDRLRRFYDAVHASGFALGVPRVLDVVEAGGWVFTVQARLPGSAPPHDDPGLPGMLVAMLAALADAPVHPDMAALPVPDGEPPFDPGVPFPTSLADLVERRAPLLEGYLDPGAPTRLGDDLRGLSPVPPALVHGDLGVGNLLVAAGRPTGLLDFGYISTVGDPAFDAAVAAALHRMLGPGDTDGTAEVDRLTIERFGYDASRLATYRAAYGLVTASCLVGHPGPHLAWCLDLVPGARPDKVSGGGGPTGRPRS